MTIAQLFVITIATLEVGAGVAYLWQGNWKLAGVWACVGIANIFMYLIDRYGM